MRVICKVTPVLLTNDDGQEINSVRASCMRCSHAAEAYGDRPESVKKALVTLREECPWKELNYYVPEIADPDVDTD